jgi:hypothetical protein
MDSDENKEDKVSNLTAKLNFSQDYNGAFE